MPAFRYVALDAQGQMQRGTMEAVSKAAVIEQLQGQGQLAMRAEPAGRSNFFADLLATEFVRRRGLTKNDVAGFTRELATMLGAGQDLDRALRFVVETAPTPRVKTVIDRVRGKVRGGAPLASALAQEPKSFSRLYIGLVRAGEAGGSLVETLERVATLLERERALASTVQSALVYPALLVVASVGSIVLLLTEVLPQFTPLFEQSGAQLPTATRMVIGLGALTATFGPWLLVAMLIGVLAARQALKKPATRLRADSFLLRLPIAGGLLREQIAARFCRTLGTLLRNGVPLIASLEIVKAALGNLAAVAAVDRASTVAKGGGSLSRALGDGNVFPPRSLHLLRLGEETAQLAPMALRAAEIHEEETRLKVQRMVALMVPAITILMGMAVAAIVGSLLMAMLSLNDLAG